MNQVNNISLDYIKEIFEDLRLKQAPSPPLKIYFSTKEGVELWNKMLKDEHNTNHSTK